MIMETKRGLETEQLKIGYDSDLVSGICIAVKPGQIVSLIGPNGSDEFVIMVFGDEAQCMGDCLAELMRMDLTCESAGKSHTFELSAGFACYPEQVDNLHGAYSKAFAALHDVKSAGKHGYVQYSA